MMSSGEAQLHFFCGKICSGKSTLASKLAQETGGILICEDGWTSALWPGELQSLEDYRVKSARLKEALWPLLCDVLKTGAIIILDFPANTRGQRKVLKNLVDTAGVPHVLHHLDVPDDVCKARLKQRNSTGAHQYDVSDEQFDQFTAYFSAPTPDEGLNICVIP